jgi:hypothetical protein
MDKDYLLLKRTALSRPSGEWNDDDYDVLADGLVVGRVFKVNVASQRETVHDRAVRRARKLTLKLGGDPADDEYPDKRDKPKRMRWATYNRLLDKLRAADGVADERLRRVLINAQMSGWG